MFKFMLPDEIEIGIKPMLDAENELLELYFTIDGRPIIQFICKQILKITKGDIIQQVNYHRQRRWLDILALEGALLGLVVILYFGAFANRFIVFCTTEVMYLDLIITNHAANSISKIRSGALKTLSNFFYQYCTGWSNLFEFPSIFTNLDAN